MVLVLMEWCEEVFVWVVLSVCIAPVFKMEIVVVAVFAWLEMRRGRERELKGRKDRMIMNEIECVC